MIRDAKMCRAVVGVLAVLGGAYVLGWPGWPCLFAKITGLPCPGCGMTRAVASLLRGRWLEAVQYHPFAPGFVLLGLPVVVCAFAPSVWREGIASFVHRMENVTRFASLFLLSALIYGLLRMGGLCSNHASVDRPHVRAWMQERQAGG
jgi:hypothetical protein